MAQPLRQFAVTPPRRVPAGISIESVVVRRLQQSDLFREYQQAFEATIGLPLVLREAGSFRPPLEGSKRINAFCALMMQVNPTCAACLQLQQRLEEAATAEAKTLECYAGLSESAVPVRVGDYVLGYLQTGQVFIGQPSRQRLKAISRILNEGGAGAVPRRWEAIYKQTRVVAPRQYQMILRLLAVFARHLGLVSNQLLIGQTPADSPMITKLRMFVAEHHREPLSQRETARAMSMSPFYFCKVIKAETGFTFTSYLARVRSEAVKELLLDVHLRVSEAAFAAGFQSISQFNRMFHRVTGETPSHYRDRLHGQDRDSLRPAIHLQAAGRERPPASIRLPRGRRPAVVVSCG